MMIQTTSLTASSNWTFFKVTARASFSKNLQSRIRLKFTNHIGDHCLFLAEGFFIPETGPWSVSAFAWEIWKSTNTGINHFYFSRRLTDKHIARTTVKASAVQNMYAVKPVINSTWEIGTTWELRTADSVHRPIQYIEMDLRNKTTSEFRTVFHSPLGVPNSQVPLYMYTIDYNWSAGYIEKNLPLLYVMIYVWRDILFVT